MSDNIQVQFYTKKEEYQVTDAAILVPTRLKRYGLSEIINHLLNLPNPIPFDFLINGKFLRTSLQTYIESYAISTETVISIEFVPLSLPPSESAALQHDDWISSVKIHREGSLILSGTFDSNISIWGQNGDMITSVTGTGASVKCVDWIDEQHVISGDNENLLKVYKYQNEELKLQYKCTGHQGSVESVAISQSGIFASGSWDKTIRLWSKDMDNLTENETVRKSGKKQKITKDFVKSSKECLEGHTGAVSCLVFDPNENSSLFSGSWDHSIRVWDINSQTDIHTMNSEKVVNCMDYNEKSHLLLTGHEDGVIRLWDPRSKDGLVVKLKLSSHSNWVSSLAKSLINEFQLCTGSYDSTVKVWDIRSATPLYTLEGSDDSKIFTVDWHGKMICCGGEDAKVRIFF